ncbi:MAG: murein biosynthesis integral membrane protein MurJ [Solirubrobacterales bacterium]|nr:murein biosynthesis integral membrane protein MurJ [Solirubrobacterales bacterium]MCB8969762.1 murein biosynthesis integral membrane protein MurJ [Thermoleophilales bacterium]MCO5327143.1 murein biosynthesis integral membrane protein MurJ [Solirubrobacterales bacterium]
MTERTDRVEPGIAIGAADYGPDSTAMEEEVVERERRLGRSTAFFSIATGLSRVAGLVREIFAASYFGVGIQMSAFTIAFLVPNLVRSLFADAALQAAFVPVFTEQLERGRKIEAFRLASTLIFAATLVLGLITALFILLAPWVMPLFAPGYSGAELDLTVSLSRVLFPILIMLGVSGIVVGVLNSYNRFGVFAIAPFFWNVAIVAVLVGLAPAFPSGDEIYAYAIGVVVGTALQLAMVAYDLRNTPFRLRRVFEWRSGLVKRVLLLMLPVTISLGLINFNLAINGIFGSLVPGEGEDAPAAIDKAFRIYMLPQGMFSVAVATVVFPTLARFAARRDFDDLRSTVANGMRMILLVLVPAASAILVLSEPMVRLVYQRGDFSAADTDLVATALFWFAFSLPFNGLFLLLTRTFFSLQRPWVPTAISALNLLVTAGVSAALYKPFGVAGIVSATALATLASVIAQMIVLRGQLNGIELGSLLDGAIRISVASLVLAAVSWGIWDVLDDAVGRGTIAQIVSLGIALLVGAAVYLGAVLAMRVPEAKQLLGVLRR